MSVCLCLSVCAVCLCLCVCVSLSLCLSLSVCLSLSRSVSVCVCLFFWVCVCLCLPLFLCLVCLFVCLSFGWLVICVAGDCLLVSFFICLSLFIYLLIDEYFHGIMICNLFFFGSSIFNFIFIRSLKKSIFCIFNLNLIILNRESRLNYFDLNKSRMIRANISFNTALLLF